MPYEEKLQWKLYDYGELLTFSSGKIVIPLIGSDNYTYAEVIDQEGNLLLEPTRAESYTGFSEGRMIIETEESIDVYDEELNIVYSLNSDEYTDIRRYVDSAVFVYYYEGDYLIPCFLDKNGEVLFDELDFSSGGGTLQGNVDKNDSDETDSLEEENLESTDTDGEATESEKVFIIGEDWGTDMDIDFETEASAEDGTGEETTSFNDRWFEIYNHFVDEEGNDIILWVSDSSAGDYIDVECNGMIRFTIWADEYSLNYDGGYYYEDSPNESFLIWYPDTNAIVVCFGGAGGSYEFHYQAG
ncbi:MAG: hypothetical protein LIO99_01175 [Clostridiales bacterium]|nr:hypothetical protein [Clostridiales bacterium]